LSRIDDIGEKDCGQHTIRLHRCAGACQEHLNLVAKRVSITCPRVVIIARKLHVLCPTYVLGKIAPMLNVEWSIARAVEHKRGNADCRKDVSHVDLVVHPENSQGCPGTRRCTLSSLGPCPVLFVGSEAWRVQVYRVPFSPVLFHQAERRSMLLFVPAPRIVRRPCRAGHGTV
jgi:hypothetical protein